ncbi:conserved hypothetical protein [delta proteobacterium NaphS2]|nr:conserved hypothetical protein [delta proteobacterium NaphS2]
MGVKRKKTSRRDLKFLKKQKIEYRKRITCRNPVVYLRRVPTRPRQV